MGTQYTCDYLRWRDLMQFNQNIIVLFRWQFPAILSVGLPLVLSVSREGNRKAIAVSCGHSLFTLWIALCHMLGWYNTKISTLINNALGQFDNTRFMLYFSNYNQNKWCKTYEFWNQLYMYGLTNCVIKTLWWLLMGDELTMVEIMVLVCKSQVHICVSQFK